VVDDGFDIREGHCDVHQHGTFHFAIQDPDLEGLLARIVAAGGKQRMSVRKYFPDEKPAGWSMWKAPSVLYLKSAATVMS